MDCDERSCWLAPRVSALEDNFRDFQTQNSGTHQKLFDRVRKLEQSDAVRYEQYKCINEKLDALLDWQDQQQGKPGRLQEQIVVSALTTMVGVLVGFFLAQLGVF